MGALTPEMDRLAAWRTEGTGMASLSQVLNNMEEEVASGSVSRYQALPTGFNPLDDILNGGMRRGDLLVVGGAFGVGKTIWALQVARNVVRLHPTARALFVCYEHDRPHLTQRLLCLESADMLGRDDGLTLRRLGSMATSVGGGGILSSIRRIPRYNPVLDAMESYADRLSLVKASGVHSGLPQIQEWVEEVAATTDGPLLMVVDYLQKIPVLESGLENESEITTHQVQTLKDLAMALGIHIVAIVASDKVGLKAKRMRLTDFRGSSAIQYEADIGLVLNNKYAIVSREHMMYNVNQAESMRGYVVMSVEKNRSGRTAVDMEYELDAAHFRMISEGDFVRERLIDDKVVLA